MVLLLLRKVERRERLFTMSDESSLGAAGVSLKFLKRALSYGTFSVHGFTGAQGFAIDTRSIEPQHIFIALRGEQVDGHDFLLEAVKKGAFGLIIDKSNQDCLSVIDPELLKAILIIMVPNTITALLDLARAWRQQFDCPIVGITGSIGKTTTKEMIHTILRQATIPCCVSYKNQNTLIGMCLTILKMRKGCKAAVFELGISQPGEMVSKVDILRPTIGVITRISHSHVQGLGSLENIFCEKRKIFTFFKDGNIGVIYNGQSLLDKASYTHPVVRFGLEKNGRSQVQASNIQTGAIKYGEFVTRFDLRVLKEHGTVLLQTNHKGHVCNALAASSVAHLLGIPLQTIIKGLNAFVPCEGRFSKRRLKNSDGLLINDCCNANPESMRAALVAFHEIEAPRKIAVLGDMLELGDKELFWHRQVGRVLHDTNTITQIILVGERAKNIAQTVPLTVTIDYARDWIEAACVLKKKLSCASAAVLVKASYAIGLENLVAQLCE